VCVGVEADEPSQHYGTTVYRYRAVRLVKRAIFRKALLREG
jgi:hypothetical protein